MKLHGLRRARHDSQSSLRILSSVLGSRRGRGQKHALSVLPVKGGQGEAEGYTESGAKKAKGGEEMTREDVVQAAIKVERWCLEHRKLGGACDCPFFYNDESSQWDCFLQDRFEPGHWGLEEFLRNRGLENGSVQ